MAVRVPTWLTDALRWRWMPTVALVLGSLIYVLGAMVLVPSDIRFSSSSAAASAHPRSMHEAAVPGSEVESTAESAESSEDGSGTSRRHKRLRRRATEDAVEQPAMPAEDTPRAEP